ncbi:unnamed protein product [Prorocentrum cordatum]|uniref:Uncharacterized protein n=1 Tax=Prorocentrum cordatum TaxID=2364126 RepID=A0ABN9PSY1_9DINO|nr:unnamed protein product [Polarella glacialis]
MAFAKPAKHVTTADSLGFGPYPGLSPKHGGQINMNAIFQSRNLQEERWYRDVVRGKPKGGPSNLGVLRGFEVLQNPTYTDVRRATGLAKLQSSSAQALSAPTVSDLRRAPAEEPAPTFESTASPSGCGAMASTWPPQGGAGQGAEAWVPGLPRRRKAPKGPLALPAAEAAAPLQLSPPPKYALCRNSMWHMTEQYPHGAGAGAAAAPPRAGRTQGAWQGPTMPKYALTQNSMWHMKDLEETGDRTKSGRNLRRVLGKSGSAPGLLASRGVPAAR